LDLDNKSITVSFKTFGCRQNQYDTDYLKGLFRQEGFHVVEGPKADLVVINTCSVTQRSEAKCRQAIRAAARSGVRVLVTGCYPQVAIRDVEDLPGVIAVTGVKNRKALLDAAVRALSEDTKVVNVEPYSPSEKFQETVVESPSLTRAYLKIQEGCNDFCTYCIVPLTRGPSRTRPLENVMEEAKKLVAKGFKEIVITGTHIGLYPDLPGLIRAVSQIPNLTRLRLSSLEPHDVTPNLLDCLRLPQVCAHLHLPLQSGSARILKSMGRRYDPDFFLRVVEDARAIAPLVGISTDIIVGFPGESDKDFEDTLKLIKEARFSRIHVFKFSARPNTRAFDMPGKVSPKEKQLRSKAVIALGRELSFAFHRKHIGKAFETLIEDKESHDGLLEGLTRNYVRVYVEGPESLRGSLVGIVPSKASPDGVLAKVR
jgi:threonylcarbamoyladenosine tRNA methylthiotransferase MtaB